MNANQLIAALQALTPKERELPVYVDILANRVEDKQYAQVSAPKFDQILPDRNGYFYNSAIVL
jgi:hypothetical protein